MTSSAPRICPHCRRRTAATTCPDDGYMTVNAERFDSDPFIGSVFQDRYRIEDRIGGGGMGTVYRAEQLAVSRKVAVKILHAKLAANLEDVKRFQREARAIAALKHPNTINLIDFGEAKDDTLFLVTELLEGEPLDALIAREAPLSPKRALTMARYVLRALAEAHGHGIVHRDLKPQNLFVTPVVGEPDFLKVLDFGIAKVMARSAATRTLTATGVAIGTPRYMAPEQAQARTVTGRTDLYALGCVMYEMLTGHPVFRRKTASDLAAAHVRDPPPPPTADGKELRGPLVDFVMTCLEKDPADRPQSALTALEELDRVGRGRLVTSDQLEAPPPTIVTRPAPEPSSSRGAGDGTQRLQAAHADTEPEPPPATAVISRDAYRAYEARKLSEARDTPGETSTHPARAQESTGKRDAKKLPGSYEALPSVAFHQYQYKKEEERRVAEAEAAEQAAVRRKRLLIVGAVAALVVIAWVVVLAAGA